MPEPPDITTIVVNTCKTCGGEGWIDGSPCPDCYDPLTYGVEKDYDAGDFGPVIETDSAVVEALLKQQLKELLEAGWME